MAKQITKLTILIDVDPIKGTPIAVSKRYGVMDGDLKKGYFTTTNNES